MEAPQIQRDVHSGILEPSAFVVMLRTLHVEARHTCQKLLERIGVVGFDCDNNSIRMVAEAEFRREKPPNAFTAVIDVFSKAVLARGLLSSVTCR